MAENNAVTDHPKVPAWLLKTFVDAIRGCGSDATNERISEEGRALLEHWCAPDRHYRNATHLARVIAAIDELAAVAHTPDLLRAAAWYAAVMPTESVRLNSDASKLNETPTEIAQSLKSLGISEETTHRLGELLAYAAKRIAPSADVDASALVDASMYDLAASPQEYRKYRKLLREEYPQLDDLHYLCARRRHIRALLKRSSIYFSPGASNWESFARQNLEAEYSNLDASICQIDPNLIDDEDVPDPLEEQINPPSSTVIIKKVGAKPGNDQRAEPTAAAAPADSELSAASADSALSAGSAESAPSAESASSADSAPSAPSAVSAPSVASAPSAPSPARADYEVELDETSGGSSLEAEPEILAPIQKEPVRRLSAKEQAREAAKKARAEALENESTTPEADL